ncbi:MAG: DUF2167 domain-containing protein [Alphaproteobacteria bacterium]|nr:DUF2167 domain-containing protein [Alphaproteobacteria bacterium]
MPRLPLTALLAVSLLAAAAAASDQGPYPETEEALEAEYAKLKWIEKPGTYVLERSGSTVTLSAGLSLLLGHDAERKLFLMNGAESPETEAVLWDRKDDVLVVYEFFGEGFVTAEGWERIDADALLESIRERIRAQNRERAEGGMAPTTVTGWREPPEYAASYDVARWAIEFDEAGEPAMIARALKLGRYGYQQFTWIGPVEQYSETDSLLDAALSGHEFAAGAGYADFRDGDTVAADGLGTLAAGAMGADAGAGAAAASFADAAAFVERNWFVVVVVALGAIGVIAGLARMMRGRRA